MPDLAALRGKYKGSTGWTALPLKPPRRLAPRPLIALDAMLATKSVAQLSARVTKRWYRLQSLRNRPRRGEFEVAQS